MNEARPNLPLHAAREPGFDPDFERWHPRSRWWLNRREPVIDKPGLRNAGTGGR